MFALKLSRAAGLWVILSSSSEEKLQQIKAQFPGLPLPSVNYKRPTRHENVLGRTNGAGFDLVLEMGGMGSLVQSIKCTRRGGTVSQIGYLGRQDPSDLAELLPILVDRRVNLR
jgi:NADPH:quinone reductase-like Zn-dependent oxidoreductase